MKATDIIAIVAIGAVGVFAYKSLRPPAPAPVAAPSSSVFSDLGGLVTAVTGGIGGVRSAWHGLFPPKTPAPVRSTSGNGIADYEGVGVDAGGAPVKPVPASGWVTFSTGLKNF